MVTKLKELFDAFTTDAEKAQAGNKSAGARARKTSLEIGKLLKDFRKESLNWGK